MFPYPKTNVFPHSASPLPLSLHKKARLKPPGSWARDSGLKARHQALEGVDVGGSNAAQGADVLEKATPDAMDIFGACGTRNPQECRSPVEPTGPISVPISSTSRRHMSDLHHQRH